MTFQKMEQLKQETRDYLYFETDYTDEWFDERHFWVNKHKKTERHIRKADVIHYIIDNYCDDSKCFYVRFSEEETYDLIGGNDKDVDVKFFDLDLYYMDLVDLCLEHKSGTGSDSIKYILSEYLDMTEDEISTLKRTNQGWNEVIKKMIQPKVLQKYIKEATVDTVTPWDGYRNGESEDD